MTDASTILLVDDDEAVRKLLSFPLERDGYEVVQAADGHQALERFGERPIDLVVLDIMLPGLDGLEVCKQLRAKSSVPIIMLTARDDELDKVLGLELGADDYVTKPFSIREFRSRTRALLRRARAPRHDPDGAEGQVIELDGLLIDQPRRLVEVDGRAVQLTYVEFELLRRLASTPGRVYSRRMLLEALWGSADFRDPRTIDVHVRHLREKLERDSRNPEFILTVRSVGYRFPGPVNPLRTVGGRLALALLVVVGGSLAIVYLIVVPSYQDSLVAGKLKDLRRTLVAIEKKQNAPGEVFPSQSWIEDEAQPLAEGARVVLFNPPPLNREPFADSQTGTSRDLVGDPIALEAARRPGIVSGSVSHGGSEYAEAATALPDGYVLWASTSLHGDLESVEVVRNRVILAASIATGFAIVLGYLLASLFARRIRRLEQAAERIAGGRFDEPVVDAAPDEVGQLARAFERMRLQLASLERARGEFIANASHELRTPLFSLGGFLELLGPDEDVDADTREEFLAEMRSQVTRLTKLATDLLDLSRMDAGRLDVGDEGFDLAVVAEMLAGEFGPRVAAAGQTLELDVQGPVYARGDETRALQIGRILVENAVVHTPPGTSIELRAGASGGRALLAVEDDGPGIPEDARQAVFERFYRLGGRVASGSGLGLAIARELATLMTGRIELDSRPGSTRFTLALVADAGSRAELASPARKG